jgi:hypothetical protein
MLRRLLLITSLTLLISTIFFGALSGKQVLLWFTTPASDGSQSSWAVRFGCLRYLWGAQGTIATGQPPGFLMESQNGWYFDWWFHADCNDMLWLVQIPLWSVAIVNAGLLAIVWRFWQRKRRPDLHP